jgi:hypothetical protein
MGYLGNRDSPPAAISNDDTNPFGNGFWHVAFEPADFNVNLAGFLVYHMTLVGPTNSQLLVYVNQAFYTSTERGDINAWDANNALFLNSGATLHFYWNSAGMSTYGKPPTVTLYLHTDPMGA